ncbi:hypothetical protein AGABI1DRAFT_111136 [Agaricus bisporus var. burnettii JB137-S8]|uniref:Uncharacterized protein n=1 Tax=Agaricus bisporus var. burnettii (strain JB137-S8 / ATCC MYA-4627 / FGSC 10392) TaxID=597362 RepID=K5X3W7_AGABU|nr:uncharacterized protein AGABI1DRAFT_111136 [Agaricus bisporus var. burnettii JB137-S8]EKM82531.1 hypothetical protein AGABI1DRAFT_111136 [Agaricus bisporus var. burnettii JB137-S8]
MPGLSVFIYSDGRATNHNNRHDLNVMPQMPPQTSRTITSTLRQRTPTKAHRYQQIPNVQFIFNRI